MEITETPARILTIIYVQCEIVLMVKLYLVTKYPNSVNLGHKYRKREREREVGKISTTNVTACLCLWLFVWRSVLLRSSNGLEVL